MPSYDSSRVETMLGELRPAFVKAFSVLDDEGGVRDVNWMTFAFAPGRINLIGEHVDYMGGFVCPAAVSEGCHILAGRVRHYTSTAGQKKGATTQGGEQRNGRRLLWRGFQRASSHASSTSATKNGGAGEEAGGICAQNDLLDKEAIVRFATTKGEYFEVTQAALDEAEKGQNGGGGGGDNGKSWTSFVLGAMNIVLQESGKTSLRQLWPQMRGLCVLIHGTLPIGAGMSASASLSVALLFTLKTISRRLYAKAHGSSRDQRDEEEFGEATMHSSSWFTFSFRSLGGRTRSADKKPEGSGASRSPKGNTGSATGGDTATSVSSATADKVAKVRSRTLLYPQVQYSHSHRVQIAKDAQRIEVKYCGVNVGIMDPFASVFSKAHCFLCLNCDTLQHMTCSLDRVLGRDGCLILINSMVKHVLVGSGYNTLRSDAEGAENAIRKRVGKHFSIADLVRNPRKYTASGDPIAFFETFKGEMTTGEYERGVYNVAEQRRTQEFIALASDSPAMSSSTGAARRQQRNSTPEEQAEWRFREAGRLLNETHKGLSDLLKVSTPEIQAIQERAIVNPGVAGARLMGGGFGGCVLVLLKKYVVANVIADVQFAFKQAFQCTCEVYPVTVDNGAFVVSLGLLNDAPSKLRSLPEPSSADSKL